MYEDGDMVNKVSNNFYKMWKSCPNDELGKEVHSEIIIWGIQGHFLAQDGLEDFEKKRCQKNFYNNFLINIEGRFDPANPKIKSAKIRVSFGCHNHQWLVWKKEILEDLHENVLYGNGQFSLSEFAVDES